MFIECTGCLAVDEVVRRLTLAEQGPIPLELSMMSPELGAMSMSQVSRPASGALRGFAWLQDSDALVLLC